MRACKDVPGLPEGMQHTINVVCILFDDNILLKERIVFMGKDSSIKKLAIDWDPEGLVGLSALFLSETPDLTGKPYTKFEEFAETMIKTAGENNIERYLFKRRHASRLNDTSTIM